MYHNLRESRQTISVSINKEWIPSETQSPLCFTLQGRNFHSNIGGGARIRFGTLFPEMAPSISVTSHTVVSGAQLEILRAGV